MDLNCILRSELTSNNFTSMNSPHDDIEILLFARNLYSSGKYLTSLNPDDFKADMISSEEIFFPLITSTIENLLVNASGFFEKIRYNTIKAIVERNKIQPINLSINMNTF